MTPLSFAMEELVRGTKTIFNYTRENSTMWKVAMNTCHDLCRNPTLKECEDDTHTPEMATQFQGSKHLALRCFLYRWKGLEA